MHRNLPKLEDHLKVVQTTYIDRILEVMQGSRKSVCSSNEFVQLFTMIGKLNDVGTANSLKVLEFYK